ncbi:MAG TPA: DUF87 domain-containing protein [Archaeoglobus sp.]|nr:DUF87 domain-containing protein [Archaeoglobus sp.]
MLKFQKQTKHIRIYEISNPKNESFLKAIDFPFTVIIDINRFAKFYIGIHSASLFGKKKNIEKKFNRLLEALSAEYDFKWIEESLGSFEGSFFYTSVYNDHNLADFVKVLILNDIRARIVLTLKFSSKWLCSFAIAANKEIGHFLKTFFREVRRISKGDFERMEKGALLNPKILKRLTIRKLPGIAWIPVLDFVVPVRFTFDSRDSIRVGKVVHLTTGRESVDAFLPVQRINQHVAILATTGAGKTNLCRHLIIELNKKEIPCLIFDWKRDYRDIAARINADVYNFSENLFTFNPLKPAGDPATWAKELANIMAEIISGSVYASGAFSIYVEIIDKLYRERGIYDGSRNYPTVFDLLDELERYSRKKLSERERNWIASALKLFRSLIVGKTRDAFSVKEGISIAGILNRNVIIELEGLGDPLARAFLISVLLQKIRNYRLERDERDVLKHVIVIEEAQNVLTADQEASSIITSTYREIRSLCEGIISITQIPSKFSKDALANTNTFFVMKLIHRDDKLLACNLLGLNQKDMKLIEHLETGMALMKTDEICLIKVPLVKRGNCQIRKTKPAREDIAASPPRRNDVARRSEDLNEKDWRVLKCIAESTAYNNSTLQKATGLSNDELRAILGKLMEKGFVRYAYAKKKGVGRRQKIYFLFPYGEEAYRQKFGEYPDVVRTKKGKRKSHGEMKRDVMKLLNIPEGKFGRFDILAEDGPIEIETGSNKNEQIYKNIKKCVEQFGFARFVVADEITFNAVLQQAAKYRFEEGRKFKMHITTYAEFIKNKDSILYCIG